jgi:ribonuclease BN (tRNA processing enzyme)
MGAAGAIYMAGSECFLVRFWGVRGSYPTPGPDTVRHGGNTSCIEVQAGRHTLILDAGTGIIRLGETLLQRTRGKPLYVSLLITHAHGDHLIGFPFFAPLFEGNSNIDCFGPSLAGRNIEQIVTPLMSPPYFPVDIHKLPSRRTFHTVTSEQCIIWEYGDGAKPKIAADQEQIKEAELRVFVKFTQSHPLNGAILYRIEFAGRCLVYATDVEWSGSYDPGFLAFVHGADLLIHDAQYTNEDYHQAKHGFGHSTVDMAIGVAYAAQVRKLILFHHEPLYDDAKLDAMEALAQTQFAQTYSASEGMEIDLLTPRIERGP